MCIFGHVVVSKQPKGLEMFGRKAKAQAQTQAQTQAEKDAEMLAKMMGSTQAMIAQFNTNAR